MFGQAMSACPLLPAESCSVWDAVFPGWLTDSIMSISPDCGQPPPARIGEPSAQKAGQ